MTTGSAFCNNCGAPATTSRQQIPPAAAPTVTPANAPPVAASSSAPGIPAPNAPTPVEEQAERADQHESATTSSPLTPVSVTPAQSQPSPINIAPSASSTKGNQGKGCITALIVALVVIVVIALAVIGGMIYLAHRVKNKVEEFAAKESQHIHDSLQPEVNTKADFSDVPGSFAPHGRLVNACPEATADEARSDETVRVPLRDGMTWVNAWRRFNGDVEVIYKVGAVTPNSVDFSTSGMGFPDGKAVKGNQVNTHRLLCRTDLQNASAYITENRDSLPDIIPQTTAFSISQKSFQELKTNGKFTLTYEQFVMAGGRLVPVRQIAELTRVEPSDVNYPIILNGQPANLPVIHARGRFHFSGEDKVKKIFKDPSFLDEDGEIFVLDDPQNSMMLVIALGPVFQVRVVSITFPQDKPKPQIEDQLAKQKKAVIYGIYFDFNQATIKKESQPVLKEIADAMKNNPGWILNVNGYTDNIGGDAYNADLSKRRSAAVKKALVDQYNITATRLTTDGFGASAPVDTNETLEGRARNRRVELIRQ